MELSYSKKAIHKSGKLFIGLTTKPEAFASKQHNYFGCLSYKKTCIRGYFYWAKKVSISENLFPILAVWTGLEPATPCVTGMYSNQLNYQTSA
jgi:hypothetical protein